MRAAHVTEIGTGPQPVHLTDPEPGSGQTLIAVRAASLNPVEIRVAAGRMPGADPPYVPGLEGVGTVISSPTLAPGTRVRFENDLPGFGKDGALREIAVAEPDAIFVLPDAVDDNTAAAAGVAGVTSELAYRLAGMEPDHRVAVLGATGGVGQMAVQLASARGASVVVAVGRDRHGLEWLEAHGATSSVNLEGSADLSGALTEAAGGPIDVVVDVLWGSPAMAAIEALADHGRLINVGNNAGTDIELPLQAMRKARTGVLGMSSGWTPLTEKMDAFGSVLDHIAAGRIEVAHEVVPLDEVAAAWERQEKFPHTKLVVSLA